jgi:hypothetical protein
MEMRRGSSIRGLSLIAGLALALALGGVSAAHAGTSVSLNGGGGSGGSGGSGGGDSGGTFSVWGYHPSAGMLSWVQGSSSAKLNPTSASFRWSKVLSGGRKTTTHYPRTDIAAVGATPVFWYQVYVVRPGSNDRLGAGNGSAVVTNYAPRWGRSDSYAQHAYWTGDYGDFGISLGGGQSGATRGLKLLGASSKDYANGAQRPIWDSTFGGSRDYGKLVKSKDGFNTPAGKTSTGSSIRTELAAIANDARQFEGRYGIFVAAARGRGQVYKSNGSAVGLGATGFTLVRPRIRVNILDAETNVHIADATWSLDYAGRDITGDLPGGALRGSRGYAAVNAGSGRAEVLAAADSDAHNATGALGTDALPLSFDTRGYRLHVAVPEGYTFAENGAGWDSYAADFYSMAQLGSADPQPYRQLASFLAATSSVDASGRGVTLSGRGAAGIAFGAFSTNGSTGGLYEVTIYARPAGTSIITDPKPTPPLLTPQIDGPSSWLDSNRPMDLTLAPDVHTETVGGKTITATPVHSELFGPANNDWARYRATDSAAQPGYVLLGGGSRTVRQSWLRPNAATPSTVIDIRLPRTDRMFPSLDGIVRDGKFIYQLGGSNPDGIVLEGSEQSVITGIGPTTRGRALVGSVPQDGGCLYLGITVYEVVETNSGSGAVLSRYYIFGELARRVVRVYTSSGTN